MTMGKKYLGAVTALGVELPQFMNFSQDGDKVILTARSSVAEGSSEIATSFPAVLFELMLADLNKNFGAANTAAAELKRGPETPVEPKRGPEATTTRFKRKK
jgi:hypothetical protein